MPELPEVETIRRDLAPVIIKKRIKEVLVLPDPRGVRALRRYPSIYKFIRKVSGAWVEDISRRGKYLLFLLNSRQTLLIHLGMAGQLIYCPSEAPLNRFARILFQLDGEHDLRFIDPRKFGELYLFSPKEGDQAIDPSKLGWEPLSDDFGQEELSRALKGRSLAIKELLLDQKIIAGIGNIYSNEILFQARIHPQRKSSSLSRKEISQLYSAIREILEEAIQCRGSSAADARYVDGFGKPGEFQKKLKVYQREGKACLNCGELIERFKIGGRSCFFCPQCQNYIK
jgi:formamidopyrimidine-DNA glycosylase